MLCVCATSIFDGAPPNGEKVETLALIGGLWLLYLRRAWDERQAQGKTGHDDLLDAIREGAVRVRDGCRHSGGFVPDHVGTGSEVMQRIAAPMVGGMVTAPLLSMSVVPAVSLLMRRPAQ